MKKCMVFLLSAVMAFSLTGCGNNKEPDKEQGTVSSYESALDVLNTVVDAYAEDDKFPMGGGDSEHLSMEGPAAFDVSKTEELDTSLGLPKEEAANIDDAASLVHMMNANTFTGAAYHVTEGTNMEDFAEAVKEHVLSRQWICGMPDTLVVLKADSEYVLTAFGADDLIETFKKNAASSLEDSKVLLETSVVEP